MSIPVGPARIVYATFATTRRSGGVHVMSEHVRLLREAGYDASLWVPGPGGPPSWFDAAVPTLVGPTQPLAADDVLVVPEVPVVPGQDPAPGGRTVIFNQNHFFTFAAASTADGPFPDWSAEPAVWTVSRESRDVLRALSPRTEVTVVPNPVNVDRFRPRAAGEASVAWFSRKRPHESALLQRLLREDARTAGTTLHPLSDEQWDEVAAVLGRATVFVALGHSEGFGLPIAEALAAGCLVTGYDGGGGRELFEAPGAWPVAEQRPLLLVDRVADLLSRRHELAETSQQNRSWVLERHSPDVTRAALVPALEGVMRRPASATTAVHPARWLDRLAPGFHLTG
ncbi:glycosyltransferase [uncultured Jatrophihabitans sp.]|uniref:glycosyltransferase n=1 Tax=uncultured Jatrophihabitans sp. TaxID=1610747 RepID=UPI0035CAD895